MYHAIMKTFAEAVFNKRPKKATILVIRELGSLPFPLVRGTMGVMLADLWIEEVMSCQNSDWRYPRS